MKFAPLVLEESTEFRIVTDRLPIGANEPDPESSLPSRFPRFGNHEHGEGHPHRGGSVQGGTASRSNETNRNVIYDPDSAERCVSLLKNLSHTRVAHISGLGLDVLAIIGALRRRPPQP